MKFATFFIWVMSVICLAVILVGGIGLLNLALKQWVFTAADSQQCAYSQPLVYPPVVVTPDKQCLAAQNAQKQSDAAQSTAELLVSIPLFVYFFKPAKKTLQ